MAEWESVIGLEVHAHLKTRTKMFCRCELEYGAAENSHTCEICLAHPGALPVPNGKAIEFTIKLGLALGCEISEHAIFARKNYFYPDLPKGYQISQYEEPLCGPGRLVVPTADGDETVGIVRAHLEEDAAKTVHAGGATGRSVGADYSLVDFNRGGTPLLEIVTEPDLRSADEADRFLRLLRQTIVELGISDAEMEKGTLRADVNVSVRQRGEDGYRPRWEIKNMNSFTFIRRAIDAAVRQQIAAHEAGETVVQSTYDYEADTDVLTVHRSKEEADDYRYFPEPDLVPVEPPAELVERLRGEVPELPAARIQRLREKVGHDAAQELVMTGNDWKVELFLNSGVACVNSVCKRYERARLHAEERGGACGDRQAPGLNHSRGVQRRVRRSRAQNRSPPTNFSRRPPSPTSPPSVPRSTPSSRRTRSRSRPTAAARRACSASSSAR